MRILFHIHKLSVGGAERQLSYLVKGLVGCGHEVHVVALHKGGHFWEDLDQWGKCTLYSLDRKSKWDFTVIPKLIRYLKSNDIGLIQGWQRPCNSFAGIAGWFLDLPVCMSIRNSNMENPLGPRLFYEFDKLLSHTSVVKSVVFNSWKGYEYHLLHGYRNESSVVIPNGIPCLDGNIVFPVPFHSVPPWRIAMLARLDPMKDHATMFKALFVLLEKNVPVELHLFGDGGKRWKQHLKNEAQRLLVNEDIHWHGFSGDVWETLGKIDIVVSSSSYGEGISNTILEAMIAGRIIVATDVGDAKRMINERTGMCGWIVPIGNSKALAKKIETIIESPKESIIRAEKAKKIVSQQYSVEIMVEKYVSLYSKLASDII